MLSLIVSKVSYEYLLKYIFTKTQARFLKGMATRGHIETTD